MAVGKGFTIEMPSFEPDETLLGFPVIYLDPIDLKGSIDIDFGFVSNLFNNTSQYVIVGGLTNKQLKRLHKKRANKTKLSRRKRKKLYRRPFKYQLTGHISDIRVDHGNASLTFRGSYDS